MIDNSVKQVIVLRKDLNMRTGKMCAQAAHASNKIILDESKIQEDYTEDALIKSDEYMTFWLKNGYTKIVVGCNEEGELLELYKKAQLLMIPTTLITDAGLTEFNGVPTNTCIAIGPYDSKMIDSLTGHLKLL